MNKQMKLLDKAGIVKAIESVARRGAKLDADIQYAGLSILHHCEHYGDSTLADALFHAMPAGSRRAMLAEWFVAFGKLRALDKRDPADAARMKEHGHVFAYDKARTTDMEGAAAKPWYEMRKKQEASEVFDAQKAVGAVLKRLQNAAQAGVKVENRAEAVAQAKALLAALEGTDAA